MPATKVFISGYYGFDNTGDEAILTVLLDELRAEFGDLAATVVSGNPPDTRALHGVETVLWSDPLAIEESVRAADLVIVGGGGLFHDYGGFLADSLFTEGNFSLGFHVTAAILAALDRRPLMLYAVGVGPLFSEHGRRFTRAACEAASVITVRDTGSRDLLASIGVDPGRVAVTADPAFALQPAPPQRALEILEAAGLGGGAPRPLLGVSVRHWAFGVHPAFWEKEVAAALDRFLDQRGGSVVFVPFQQLEGVQENDLAVAGRVHAQMRHRERAQILAGRFRVAETAAVLGACDVVLGMRLHSLIFSAVAGVPFVGLRYDPKVEEIARQLEATPRLVDLGAVTAEGLARHLEEALDDDGTSLAVARRESLASRAADNARFARRALASPPPEPTPLVVELIQTGVRALLETQKRLLGTEARLREILADSQRHAASLQAQHDQAARELLAARQRHAASLQAQHDQAARELLAARQSHAASLQAQHDEMAREHADRLRQLGATHAAHLAQLEADREERLAEARAASQPELSQLRAELDGRDRQIDALSQVVLRRQDTLGALHERLALIEARAAGLGISLHPSQEAAELSAARKLRDEVAEYHQLLDAWRRFAADYRRSLALLRNHPAWTVMLAARRAHARASRGGLFARLWPPLGLLGWLSGSRTALQDEEPKFPEPPKLPGDK